MWLRRSRRATPRRETEVRRHVRPSYRCCPPPSLSRQSPSVWTQLPQPNRHHLLWLLSQLLERQLRLPPAIDKECNDESDSCTTAG